MGGSVRQQAPRRDWAAQGAQATEEADGGGAPVLTASAVVRPVNNPPRIWRGLGVAEEDRYAPYGAVLYRNTASVEEDIVRQLGAAYSPYTCESFDSTRKTDIEHIVARSEAHDKGLCGAGTETCRRFARHSVTSFDRK